MPMLTVTDVGSIGVVTDVDPVLLPPNAWTGAANVRFADNEALKITGHSSVATPSVTPYYLLPITKSTTAYWVYAGLDKVYSWNGTAHTNITRQTTGADVDYTGGAADYWTGGVLNNVLILNNGLDDPQMWVNTKLESLTWDSGATWGSKGYSANTIRPYKNFLVALNWTDGTNKYPQTVYWSNQADPNTVPSDWDFADPANEAGTAELASTQGIILDGEQLRDAFIVYKEDAIHLMQFVGGTFVMTFKDVSKTTGALAQRCAKEFYGKHAVFANDDLIVLDGQNVESIASKRVRRTIFSSIDSQYFTASFVARNLSKEEIWFCYAETGSALPNIAAIWNWRDNTWTWRDLPSVTHIGFGIVPSGAIGADWNSDSGQWDADSNAWGEEVYNPATQSLVAGTAGDLFKLDDTLQFDGTEITAYVQRDGLLLDTQAQLKTVRAIYPRATGGAMQVSIGSKFDVNASYVWEGPYTFTPGTDHVVRVRSTGRFHAVKFCFCQAQASALQGYDIEWVAVGGR